MRVRVSVREKDHGFKAMIAAAAALKKGGYVKVGVLDEGEGAVSRGTLTNAELAALMELGWDDVEPRPFISASVEAGREQYMADLKKLAGGLLEGKITLERALGIIGAKAAADIKKFVTLGNNLAPNRPSTIARKGSSRPLIDSGQLVGAVTWFVVLGAA